MDEQMTKILVDVEKSGYEIQRFIQLTVSSENVLYGSSVHNVRTAPHILNFLQKTAK